MIADLDLLKQILVKEFDNFSDHSVSQCLSIIMIIREVVIDLTIVTFTDLLYSCIAIIYYM